MRVDCSVLPQKAACAAETHRKILGWICGMVAVGSGSLEIARRPESLTATLGVFRQGRGLSPRFGQKRQRRARSPALRAGPAIDGRCAIFSRGWALGRSCRARSMWPAGEVGDRAGPLALRGQRRPEKPIRNRGGRSSTQLLGLVCGLGWKGFEAKGGRGACPAVPPVPDEFFAVLGRRRSEIPRMQNFCG